MNPSKKRTTVSKNERHSLFADRKTACRSENLAGSSLTFLVCAERFSHGGTFFLPSCTLQLVCLNKNPQMHYSCVVSCIGRLLFHCPHLSLCLFAFPPQFPTLYIPYSTSSSHCECFVNIYDVVKDLLDSFLFHLSWLQVNFSLAFLFIHSFCFFST